MIRQIERHPRKRGFTLVEVLIVVVILGILAATVLPQFGSTGDDARLSALTQNLQTMRSQVQLYRYQHNSAYPAAGSTDPQDFVDAMVKASKSDGTTADPGTSGYPYGPYLVGQIPPNPFNGLNTVALTDDMATATFDGATGWMFDTVGGEFRANLADSATTPDGTRQLNEL